MTGFCLTLHLPNFGILTKIQEKKFCLGKNDIILLTPRIYCVKQLCGSGQAVYKITSASPFHI